MAIKKREAPTDDILEMDLSELDEIMNQNEDSPAETKEEKAPPKDEASKEKTVSNKDEEADDSAPRRHRIPGRVTKRFSGKLVEKILEGMIDEEYLQEERESAAAGEEAEPGTRYLVSMSTGQMFAIKEEKVMTIGKDPSFASILIQDNATVSRKHAEVLIDKESNLVFVKDLGSRNGTQINGNPLDQGDYYILQNEDVIVFSDEAFKLIEG